MANLLSIETSSQVLSVALKTADNKVDETKIVGFLMHAENLMPLIDKLLLQNGITINDIDAFLIGRGPGSFTGLRIGLATLKGFIMCEKKPCFGALSLDMIAANVPVSEKQSLVVCMDARRDTVFARKYTPKNNQWVASEEPQIISISKFIASIENDMILTGNLLERHQEEIQKQNADKKITFQPSDLWAPKASTLINWKMENNSFLVPMKSAEDFTPHYFRLSEAEERRNHALNS